MKKFLPIVFLLSSFFAKAQPELWTSMSLGSTFGLGGIIKLNGDGSGFANVYDCAGGTAGASLQTNFLPDGSSWLYGTTVSGGTNSLGDIFRYNTSTGIYTSLFSMDSVSGYY